MRLPYRGDGAPIAVLLLISAAGGNIPTTSILDDRQFPTTVLVTEYADPNMPLPPHDLVFNSIGDADLCREGLKGALAVLARTDRPVINHPGAVLKTGRAANAERLRGLPDVIVPRMVDVARGGCSPRGSGRVRGRAGICFSVFDARAGFSYRPLFRARRRAAEELMAAAAHIPGDEHVPDRSTRCARRRRIFIASFAS